MERYRIVYYNVGGEASEATVDADEGNEAIAQVEDLGRLCTIESLGPAEEEHAPLYAGEEPDNAVNEGDAEPVKLLDYPRGLPYVDPYGEDA